MLRDLIILGLALLVPTAAASACGRKCAARHHRRAATCRVVYAAPTSYTYATPQAASHTPLAASPAAAPSLAPAAAPPSPGVVPSYEYPTQPGVAVAYYYTYDDSGKLIIQQWMDFLFRGGKKAGMPRPPLPIVGNFQRR